MKLITLIALLMLTTSCSLLNKTDAVNALKRPVVVVSTGDCHIVLAGDGGAGKIVVIDNNYYLAMSICENFKPGDTYLGKETK